MLFRSLPPAETDGGLPGSGRGEASTASGPGRGAASPPKPFMEPQPAPGRPAALPHDGAPEIVVTEMVEGVGRKAADGPAAPDSALARGTSLAPAPLLDWPPPAAAKAEPAGAARAYQPRQALPAWAQPLVPVPAGPRRP